MALFEASSTTMTSIACSSILGILHSFGDLDAEYLHGVFQCMCHRNTEAYTEGFDCGIGFAKDGGVLIETVEILGKVIGVVGNHGRAETCCCRCNYTGHVVESADNCLLFVGK